MNTTKVIEETLNIRAKLKSVMDSVENPIDMLINPVSPFKGSGDIKVIIIGQDPTIKNEVQRRKVEITLNLDKNGSLKTYISTICDALGVGTENVYATNIFKYFYSNPPAKTMDVLYNHLDMNLKLLRNEIQVYKNQPVITLGEPVLRLLSYNHRDKVRNYWDYKKGVSGNNFTKCLDNGIDRPFYPFPHQPSISKEFYWRYLKHYLLYVKDTSGV